MATDIPFCYDVVHIGPYFCDLIITGLPDLPHLGSEIYGTEMQMAPGGAFNTTYALHRLGLKTGWVTDFGTDFFSQFVLAKLKELGIDPTFFRMHTHDLCALSVAFSYSHERGFISYTDSCEPWDLLTILRDHRPRCVLLGGLEYSPDFLEFAAAARQMGSKLFMDCQHREATLQTPGVVEALRAVDTFMPNQCEACKLTGLPDVEAAARQLAEMTPLVVVKLGAQGALAVQGEQVVHIPGIHVESVVDTTGAGDCFNAGFLYGYLRGESLESCLRYANLLGGISVTGHGVSQMPTREQVEALVVQYDALMEGEIDLPPQPGLGWSFKRRSEKRQGINDSAPQRS
jgi:sugar/nucleoside kinase (ribokinase family)